MKVSLIAAVSRNRVIGRDGALPWHLSADLKRFKRLTLRRPIIMGRKTWDSIGKPLPKRPHLVLSRSGFAAEGVTVYESLEAALAAWREATEVCIIGGEAIYATAWRYATHLHLTVVHTEVEGDAFFPAWPEANEWICTADVAGADPKAPDLPFSFRDYVRRSSA